MNRNQKNKKIKKLTKTRIWPSVLFLFFSLIITIVVYFMFVGLMVLNQMSDRFNYTFVNAINIISSFDAMNGNEEAAIKNLQSNTTFSNAAFVFDKNDNLIAGYGEPTYNENVSFPASKMSDISEDLMLTLDIDDSYVFYGDSVRQNNLFDNMGNLHLNYILEADNSSVFSKENLKNANFNSVLFEARFWIKAGLSNDRSILIKCMAPLYLGDFEKAIFIGSIAFVIMLFPTVFFFINVIVSIHGQRRMTKLLYTDTTTGGNSYIYFEHAAGKELNARRNFNRQFVIADITIMKYRSYRNCHGIHAGEQLLENVHKEISKLLGKKEFCSHVGKSSFVVFLKCEDKSNGEARIRTIIDTLSETFDDSCIVFHSGIFFCEPHNAKNIDPADCLSHASAARASLTDENAAGVAVYDDKLLEEQLWTHKVEEKMQAALDREEFKVYIQPKYDPVTEKLAGAEALIRWINDEDGFISPGRFIPIFENNGFITKIDDYMISHVAKLQAEWLKQGKAVVPISVNVSRAHFANPDLAEHIRELVDQYEVPHNLIEIELTESAFFDDKAALLKTVHNLRELGFEISMDDFGAGYSSLNSLKDLPLDVLKLDADFFRGEDEESRGEIVVSQAIQLAKSLNMRIVAEGIEKKEQVDFLAKQGCDMIQGFYYAKPMPVDEYEQKL